jgi:ArsR family transcriptional regulator, nickel/cobalt-responsive transcriptional repressor
MPHPLEHTPATSPLGRAEAEVLAESLRAFGAASRLRLMAALLAGERTVEDLARASELTPSAASQQLRVLRQLRLVAVRREGRRSYYRLHDSHVADLLVAIRHHYEHLDAANWPPGLPDRATTHGEASGG